MATPPPTVPAVDASVAALEEELRATKAALLETERALAESESRWMSRIRQTEEELDHAREILELSVEVGRIGIWHGDIVANTFQFNSIMHAMVGRVRPASTTPSGEPLDVEQVIADVHPNDRERVRLTWENAMRDGGRFDVTQRVLTGDGGARHVHSTGQFTRDENGVAIRVLGTAVDVSEQYALAHALAIQQQALAMALEAGGVGFWQYDIERDRFQADARVHELYRGAASGFLRDVAPGEWGGTWRQFTATLSPEDGALLRAQTAAILGGEGMRTSGEFCVPLEDGTQRFLRSSSHFVRGPDGTFERVVGLNWDVTAEHAHAAMLQRAREAADDANRAKGQFLANMSHEIRTPMNGVLGMVALALETQLTGDQEELVRSIQSSAESLLAVINDILDFSKVDAGKLDIHHVVFDLRASVADALKPLTFRAQQRGIAIEWSVAADLPSHILSDWSRIRQVIVNLVDNAVKFTDHGSVTIAFTSANDGSGERLACRVTDTGIGIAPELRARIFEPFEQADGAVTRRHGGTGLGLAISSRLIAMMGGELTVESALGRGSVFAFTLPLVAGRPPVARAPQHVRDARSLSILVAEDNIVNQRVTQILLERRGHQVRIAGNGRLVLEALAEAHFDVVLMDIDMPELDGLATTAHIRSAETPGGARLPIIALTAHAMAGDRERFLAAGLDGYLTKPLRPESIFTLLEQLSESTP